MSARLEGIRDVEEIRGDQAVSRCDRTAVSLCVRVDVASIELKKLQFDRAIERSDDHRIFTRI